MLRLDDICGGIETVATYGEVIELRNCDYRDFFFETEELQYSG
jgi:hypothetical protein